MAERQDFHADLLGPALPHLALIVLHRKFSSVCNLLGPIRSCDLRLKIEGVRIRSNALKLKRGVLLKLR
jgi:hypothetical protein